MSGEFCDTDVLVYAHDAEAGARKERAQALVERLWTAGNGVLSVQVLQELYVTLTRKLAKPMSGEAAREVVSYLAHWQVVAPSASDVVAAIDLTSRWQISFWDAMVLRTAHIAGATVLWSEDLTDGQDYDGIIVRNPFV